MKREKVISVLRFYRDIEKSIKLNERVIKNLEDQYYTTLGAVNMDGMPPRKRRGRKPRRAGRAEHSPFGYEHD